MRKWTYLLVVLGDCFFILAREANGAEAELLLFLVLLGLVWTGRGGLLFLHAVLLLDRDDVSVGGGQGVVLSFGGWRHAVLNFSVHFLQYKHTNQKHSKGKQIVLVLARHRET